MLFIIFTGSNQTINVFAINVQTSKGRFFIFFICWWIRLCGGARQYVLRTNIHRVFTFEIKPVNMFDRPV